MGYNQDISITVDAVVFRKNDKDLELLLIQRKNEPFKNQWALPGGFLEVDEELETGAKRELKEETGLHIQRLTQLRAFGELGRDPRGRTISVAFYGYAEGDTTVKASDDAKGAQWFPVSELPKLAFDHAKIIEDVLKALK